METIRGFPTLSLGQVISRMYDREDRVVSELQGRPLLSDTPRTQAPPVWLDFGRFFLGYRKNEQPKPMDPKPIWWNHHGLAASCWWYDICIKPFGKTKKLTNLVEHFFNRSLHHITLTILQHAVYALGMAGTWRQQKVAKHRHKEPPQREKTDRIDPHLEGDDFSFLMVIQSGETVNLHRRFH